MTKISKIVKQVKKLYAELNKLLKTPFSTQAAQDRSLALVKQVSNKLFAVTEVFYRNFHRIKQMPYAVARAMGKWWPAQSNA